MNKLDLIEALAKRESLIEKEAMEILNMVFDRFANELKNGNRIEIRGFGSFSVRKYDAYQGRNPRTGKVVAVKSKRLPFFKVGKELKKRVEGR